MKIRRLSAAALLAAALGAGMLANAAPAAATPAATSFAYIVGYYPSYASCSYVGEQGRRNGTWPWYTCFQSGSVWALQVPG
ncbi:hypothetical protein [Streptosporangium carneum]|uniref:Secreted protein n=1 Tax=Streptosporangium carneum TaxID=47481 RepID=A0A9W6I6S0_9ACTN|nr:hypothetical protein [Streptosporangium carneum]GLK12218.1 hypothetical protein GCM10017600_56270 [Streptosporangium carneum]